MRSLAMKTRIYNTEQMQHIFFSMNVLRDLINTVLCIILVHHIDTVIQHALYATLETEMIMFKALSVDYSTNTFLSVT